MKMKLPTRLLTEWRTHSDIEREVFRWLVVGGIIAVSRIY